MATSPSTSARQSTDGPRRPPAFVNKAMAGILRVPFLHRIVSKNVLLLTFTGRKSGRSFTTPISYWRNQGKLVVFTGSPWSKNLRGGALVQITIQGIELQGFAELIEDRAIVVEMTRAYLTEKGVKNARMIGLQFEKNHLPTDTEIDAATQGRVAILISSRS